MTSLDQTRIPVLKDFALTKFKIECPSIAILEFFGAEGVADDVPRAPELRVWTFAFFDLAIHRLDICYGEMFSPVKSVTVVPAVAGEWRFQVDVNLDPGSIMLRCREFYFFSRTSTEQRKP